MRELEPEVIEIEGVKIVAGRKKFGNRYVEGYHLPGGLFTANQREAVKTMKVMRYYASAVKVNGKELAESCQKHYTDTPKL